MSLEAILWQDGIRVWLDWPISHEHYVDQMLSMMNEADLVVIVLDRKLGAMNRFSEVWTAALRSNTRKFILQLGGTTAPSHNATFTVDTCEGPSNVADAVARFIKHGLRLAIFVSYAHKDRIYANGFVWLAKHSLSPVWIDRSGLKAGRPFPQSLMTAIESTSRFVLLWSSRAAASSWVEREWRYAVASDRLIAPVALDNTPLPLELETLHSFRSLHDDALLDWLSISDRTRQSFGFRAHQWWDRVRRRSLAGG